ncbi:MAG: thiamine pyrophosphate-dependent dehydrogenase E1 component subunit alpha [Limisphaerales bacterium]
MSAIFLQKRRLRAILKTAIYNVPMPTVSEAGSINSSLREEYLTAYRWMLLARLLDDKLASLYRAGKIFGGVYLGRGQEAVSVSVGMALKKGDVFAPLIRDGAGRLAFGENILDAVRTCMGSPLGPMRGRDGNVHRGRPKEGLLPMLSHLGSMISVINGVMMARRYKGENGTVGAACLGEGGTSTGAFHEAMNQAAVEKVPLVMVVVDNQYAYSTPTSRQFACKSLVDRAIGYGIQGHRVDGTRLEDCLNTLRTAVENARAGRGPQLVVADLLRLCGHGEHDDASYIDPLLKQSPMGCDCLKLAEAQILQQHWADDTVLASWRSEAQAKIEEAVAIVQRDPVPDGYKENWQALASKHLGEVYPDVE